MRKQTLFPKAVRQRCLENDFICDKMWILATGVLVAQLKINEDLGFYFCYDSQSMKLEDMRNQRDKIEVPLFRMEWAYYVGHGRELVSIFRFGGNLNLIENVDSALNFATQVLSRIDGKEIGWLSNPKEIKMDFG